MTKINNSRHPSNFWFGFAMGISGAAALGYFLGTKKGRDTAQKIIHQAGNIEEGSDIFFDIIQALNKYVKQGGAPVHQAKDSQYNLNSLIEKVKHITDGKEKDIFINHNK